MKKMMKDVFLKLMFSLLKKIHEFHNDLPFLPEKFRIKKFEKLVANLHDKTEYVIHINNLKPALKRGLVLKKVRSVIIFNQNAWLKPYVNINTDLREKQEINLKTKFLS